MNSLSQKEQKEQKDLVGKRVIDTLIEKRMIFSGMKIGLGTGSTAMSAVKRLAERIDEGTLKDIKAVPTSFQTTIACEELGISVYTLNSKSIDGQLDLAIDGADEISPQKHLIKGGGAAHVKEKIVAYNANTFVIIADQSKLVHTLGTKFALPVEIIADARRSTIQKLEKIGAHCVLREGIRKCGPVITDNGNQIIDCTWDLPVDAAKMEDAVNNIIGVVENGFFTKREPVVFIAYSDGSVKEL
ncbi:MAG TPA: ribose-5-phosphate isomerase RpiA [Treponemataceae bacterium]|nr:ribose-5-phosphate isomerase RpiA [Treponemataceae bacterium]